MPGIVRKAPVLLGFEISPDPAYISSVTLLFHETVFVDGSDI